MLPPPALDGSAEHRLRRQRDALMSGLPAAASTRWSSGSAPATIRPPPHPDPRARRVWNLPEHDLLRVALHATRAGLLTLSWDTVCPHCRGVRDENPSLAQLAAHSRCDACQVEFATDTPESVEVTFRVHSSVRDVPDQVYCSAEPLRRSTSASSAPSPGAGS